jgi:preprotein translocase subunit YajC
MIDPAWAQAATPPSGPPPFTAYLPMYAMLAAVVYLLFLRPQNQKAKEHRSMLANLKRNDEVITAGGLYGKVVQLSDKIVTLEIAPNVRVRVDRPQIVSLANSAPPEDAKEKDKQK